VASVMHAYGELFRLGSDTSDLPLPGVLRRRELGAPDAGAVVLVRCAPAGAAGAAKAIPYLQHGG
jgi:hypothetical protein